MSSRIRAELRFETLGDVLCINAPKWDSEGWSASVGISDDLRGKLVEDLENNFGFDGYHARDVVYGAELDFDCTITPSGEYIFFMEMDVPDNYDDEEDEEDEDE